MKLNWFIGSVIALFSLGTMSFLITLMTRRGLPTSFVLLGICVTYIVYYIIQTVTVTHYKPELSIPLVLILIAIGLLSTVGNILLFNAANDAPNPGLALAIGGGLQTAVVTILAFIFLKDKMSGIQIAGIVFGVVGVFLINLGSKGN